MKKSAVLVLLMIGFAHGQRALPPDIVHNINHDPVQLDPIHYKVDIDNERVRVLHVRLGPDEAVPEHDDESSLVVAISEVHIRYTPPSKRSFDVHMAAGETRWGYADTHSIKNLIDRPAEFIIVELKKGNRRGL